MPTHGAKPANGHVFYRGDELTATGFVAVSYLRSVSVPSVQPQMQTVTVHGSAAVQKKGTLVEIGSFNVALNWDITVAAHAAMLADAYAVTERYYQIEEPDGTLWNGPANIGWNGQERTPEQTMQGNFTIYPTDVWTTTAP